MHYNRSGNSLYYKYENKHVKKYFKKRDIQHSNKQLYRIIHQMNGYHIFINHIQKEIIVN